MNTKTVSLIKQIIPQVKLDLPAKWAKKPRKRYRAMVVGNEDLHLQAAEILEQLDAGAPLKSIEIPPAITIEPTQEQLEDVCREFNVEPPAWPIADGGWRSRIFMSAPQDLFTLLGGPVVLLEVRPRTKRPVRSAWQKLTIDEMTPEYLAGLMVVVVTSP